MRPAIAPVQLGCCHESTRCLLCPPPPEAPAADTVAALLQHTIAERAQPDQAVWVGFYGGPPPSDELIDAIGGAPFTARVRPDLLSRADARRLVDRGAVAVELDALTLSSNALRRIGRTYGQRLILEQLSGLRDLGVEVGVVLAQGLPDSDHASCIDDARRVAPLVHTARLHPVLVLHNSGLRDAHMHGHYRPLSLGETVTVCRDLLDLLEGQQVRVIRVGTQPGPDGLGRAVAGPRHSSLRELVETRRTLDRIRACLPLSPVKGPMVIRCAPADVSRVRGPYNQHIRTLRAELGVCDLMVEADTSLLRGTFLILEAESR